MSKAIIAVVAIIAVIAAGVLIYHEVTERPEYHVDDMHEAVGLVTFTASAELDEAATVTVWAGDTKMSMLGIDEWTASAGSWEQTFIMTLDDYGGVRRLSGDPFRWQGWLEKMMSRLS